MNKDKRNNIKLLGTLNNADESGIIANANQIYDANEDKSTQDVSKEHTERIKTLEDKEDAMQTTLENISKTGEASAASNVTYNHNDSKLDATNVQQAVDELATKKLDSSQLKNQDSVTILDSNKKKIMEVNEKGLNARQINLVDEDGEIITALNAEQFNKKFDKENIVHGLGESEDKVMSQKAVSEKLKDKLDASQLKNQDSFTILGSDKKKIMEVNEKGLNIRQINFVDEDGEKQAYLNEDQLFSNYSFGRSCKIQENVGKYYKIKAIEKVTDKLSASFDYGNVKWGKSSVRLSVRGVGASQDTNYVTRGSVVVKFDNIKIKHSLGIWLMMPSIYALSEEKPNTSNIASVPKMDFYFYKDGNVVSSYKDLKLKIGSGWRSGWFLFKFFDPSDPSIAESFKDIEIDSMKITIETLGQNPNCDIFVDSLVADQKMFPTFEYSLDGSQEGEVSLPFILWLYKNRFPVSLPFPNFDISYNDVKDVNLDELIAEEVIRKGLCGKHVLLKGYMEGIFGIGIYTQGTSYQASYTEEISKLEEIINDKIKLAEQHGNNINRPILAAHQADNRLSDTDKLAEEKVGLSIMRGGGYCNNGTHYIDKHTNVVNAGLTFGGWGTIDDLTDEYIQSKINKGKHIIDEYVKYGGCIDVFSHWVVPKANIEANTGLKNMCAEIVIGILTYVKELASRGELCIMNLEQLYTNSLK